MEVAVSELHELYREYIKVCPDPETFMSLQDSVSYARGRDPVAYKEYTEFETLRHVLVALITLYSKSLAEHIKLAKESESEKSKEVFRRLKSAF